MANKTQPITLQLGADNDGLTLSLAFWTDAACTVAASGVSAGTISAGPNAGDYATIITHPDTLAGCFFTVINTAGPTTIAKFAFAAAALLPSEVPVNVLPLTAQATANAFTNTDRVPLRFVRGERRTITITCSDADGEPVDLSDKSLRFLIKDQTGTGVVEVESGANLTVTGEDNDTAAITVTLAANITTLKGTHEFWNLTDSVRLAYGPVTLEGALKDVP